MYFNQSILATVPTAFNGCTSIFWQEYRKFDAGGKRVVGRAFERADHLFAHLPPSTRTDRRDNVVLYNMRQAGAITEAGISCGPATSHCFGTARRRDRSSALFYEYIRKYLERTYGLEVLYDGATVQTTLDSRLQRVAEEVVSRNVTGQLKDRVVANWKRNPPDSTFLPRSRRDKTPWPIWCCRARWSRWIPHTGHILAYGGGPGF